jgi:hypothetical protein
MKKLLSFDEFVNEHYKIQEATDADGFNPQNTTGQDPTGPALKSVSELLPGKEYVITVDGNVNTDMYYAGVTDGVHLFNGEDKANDVQMTDVEIADVIAKGGFVQVLEGVSTSKKNSRRLVRTSSSSTINEGKLSVAKAIAELSGEFDAQTYIDEKGDDKPLQELVREICKHLGAEPKDVFGLDENFDDDLYDTYKALKSKFRGTEITDFPKAEADDYITFDSTMNVLCMGEKYGGFEIYWFTAKSKF